MTTATRRVRAFWVVQNFVLSLGKRIDAKNKGADNKFRKKKWEKWRSGTYAVRWRVRAEYEYPTHTLYCEVFINSRSRKQAWWPGVCWDNRRKKPLWSCLNSAVLLGLSFTTHENWSACTTDRLLINSPVDKQTYCFTDCTVLVPCAFEMCSPWTPKYDTLKYDISRRCLSWGVLIQPRCRATMHVSDEIERLTETT